MADLHYHYQFRLILIGDSTVGKSSLLRQFKEGAYAPEISLTVGVDFHARLIHLNGQTIKLQLWDTAGQDRFRAIVRAYYRNAVGGLLVFDITNRESFTHLDVWLEDAQQNADKHRLVFVLVGNKTDQHKHREVTREEGLQFAEQHGMEYIETSAKNAFNVEEAFHMVARKILNYVDEGSIRVEDGWDGVKKGQPPQNRRSLSPLRSTTVSLHSQPERDRPQKSKCCGGNSS